jgi:hypothetical protein
MPRTNCWALILIVLLSSSASYGQNYKNGEATHDLRVTGQLYEAVGQAASLFRTVIGVEEVASLPYVKPVKLQIEHATLTETMDAIIQADSRYSWRVAKRLAIEIGAWPTDSVFFAGLRDARPLSTTMQRRSSSWKQTRLTRIRLCAISRPSETVTARARILTTALVFIPMTTQQGTVALTLSPSSSLSTGVW